MATFAENIEINLHPTENVPIGKAILVTFGVPFPPKFLKTADIRSVRVLHKGMEIPAFVEEQTPWRHFTELNIEQQSVRVLRIQIHFTFTVSFPDYEMVVVEWKQKEREKNVESLENPRNAWHQVTTGSFDAGDQVYEPDVFAVLPKEYLCLGYLRSPMIPSSNTIGAERDHTPIPLLDSDPDYLVYDFAAKNFFYTTINEGLSSESSVIWNPYKTKYEPWLYDRSSTMYVLYMRTGSLKALREAVRSTEFYRNHIGADGMFTLKPYDLKYCYTECLAYSYWLTGDNDVLRSIPSIVTAFEEFPSRWNSDLYFWTERHTGFKLLANVIAYEVLGTASYQSNIETMVEDFIWHQDGADGRLPEVRMDGGLYHDGKQHDEGEGLIASPWMSALLVDAMVRAYGVSDNEQIAVFIARMGTMLAAACRTDNNHLYGIQHGDLTYPDYLIKVSGVIDMRDGTDTVEHAINVGTALAWSAYFAEKINMRSPLDSKEILNRLYDAFRCGVVNSIKTAPTHSREIEYHMKPWRKYGWQYRTTGSFSWLCRQL